MNALQLSASLMTNQEVFSGSCCQMTQASKRLHQMNQTILFHVWDWFKQFANEQDFLLELNPIILFRFGRALGISSPIFISTLETLVTFVRGDFSTSRSLGQCWEPRFSKLQGLVKISGCLYPQQCLRQGLPNQNYVSNIIYLSEGFLRTIPF